MRRRISSPMEKIRWALASASLAYWNMRGSGLTAYSMALPWGMTA
jgi:hypothetical protein